MRTGQQHGGGNSNEQAEGQGAHLSAGASTLRLCLVIFPSSTSKTLRLMRLLLRRSCIAGARSTCDTRNFTTQFA